MNKRIATQEFYPIKKKYFRLYPGVWVKKAKKEPK